MHSDPSGSNVQESAAPGDLSGARILFLTPNFENNSLGRTYCLWLLARQLGMDTRVSGVKGNLVWTPLQGTEFADHCRLPPAGDDRSRTEFVRAHVRWADMVVAVKPLPSSFGLGLELCEQENRSLALDIDDPDLEVRTVWLPWYERIARRALTARYRELRRLGALTTSVPVTVSNPVLARTYPGTIIPHVRPAPQLRHDSTGTPPTVWFIGSPRGHKGVGVLRAAVASLQAHGYRLAVTAPPPPDAHPWESWIGNTGLAEGAALVAEADIIAIPSLAGGWSPAQLPAKLIDAMVAGRPVVASDVPPIRWALGQSGILVPPGDASALAVGLLELASPVRRRELGRSAAARADGMFTVESVAPAFAAFVGGLMAKGRPRRCPGPWPAATDGVDLLQAQLEVVIAVLTFRRPGPLAGLLPALLEQTVPDAATISVLVVDNDPDGTGAEVVDAFGSPRVTYVHEPRPGIAAARNRALVAAGGADVLIFVDDDEMPVDDWLPAMLYTFRASGAVGVVGPVVSEYDADLEPWLAAGDFFRRRRMATGTAVSVAATNNLLVDLHAVRAWSLRFDEKFGLAGGSDTLFTLEIVRRGGRLIWCDEAVVIDRVPVERLTRQWVLQRALRSGNSWSRATMFMGRGHPSALRERLSLAADGAVRLTGGSARYVGGLVSRSLVHQAKGARTAARGAGMLIGAAGLVYSEYARAGSGRTRGPKRFHRDRQHVDSTKTSGGSVD